MFLTWRALCYDPPIGAQTSAPVPNGPACCFGCTFARVIRCFPKTGPFFSLYLFPRFFEIPSGNATECLLIAEFATLVETVSSLSQHHSQEADEYAICYILYTLHIVYIYIILYIAYCIYCVYISNILH